jgi:CheY-like chemotaxis protein
VLLDIGMPKLEASTPAGQIRARANGRCPLLVALTGWDQEQHRRRSEEAGFDRHLIKPVDPALLAELSELTPRRRAAEPPLDPASRASPLAATAPRATTSRS